MKKLSLFSIAVLVMASPVATSYATLVGMYDPYGRSSDPANVNYAVWDSFSEAYASGSGTSTLYTYSGIASGGSTLTGLSLSQSSAHINQATSPTTAQGAGLLESGDVYYSSTKAQTWTLTATTSIDITTMAFQVKTANTNEISILSVFQPSLVGVGTASYFRSAATGESISNFSASVIEYRWDNLNIEAGTTFTITFDLAGGNSGNFTRKPIDFVALDAAAVPEPSTYALVALGLGIAALKVRRRVSRH